MDEHGCAGAKGGTCHRSNASVFIRGNFFFGVRCLVGPAIRPRAVQAIVAHRAAWRRRRRRRRETGGQRRVLPNADNAASSRRRASRALGGCTHVSDPGHRRHRILTKTHRSRARPIPGTTLHGDATDTAREPVSARTIRNGLSRTGGCLGRGRSPRARARGPCARESGTDTPDQPIDFVSVDNVLPMTTGDDNAGEMASKRRGSVSRGIACALF